MLLVAANHLAPNPGHLPIGPYGPRIGLHCHGSISALGTSNVFGNGSATTVVNIWQLKTRASNNAGYLVKAHDGSFWYESPIGLNYQRLSAEEWSDIINKDVTITACFNADLAI